MESRGLGDTIAKITEITGIKKIVEKTNELLGTECNCSRRQEVLNNIIPYKQTQSINFESMSFKSIEVEEGIYIINNNLSISKEGIQYNYKIGDKIFIKLDNPIINDLSYYIGMGIISKI